MPTNQIGCVFVKKGTSNSQTLWGLTDTNTYTQLQLGGVTVVKAASTANVASLSGTTMIDGTALVAGDTVLLKNQSTASQNGVYKIASGAWTKTGQPSDVFVTNGTIAANTMFILKSANTYQGVTGVYT